MQNVTKYKAVRKAARIAVAQSAKILCIFAEKRVSTQACNIFGKQLKFYVWRATQETVAAVQQAVAQHNCTAVAKCKCFKRNCNCGKIVYIKVLRNK